MTKKQCINDINKVIKMVSLGEVTVEKAQKIVATAINAYSYSCAIALFENATAEGLVDVAG